MDVKAMLDTIPVRTLAKAANVSPGTVTRAKLRNSCSDTPAGRRLQAALDARFGPGTPAYSAALKDDLQREDLKAKRERARQLKIQNDLSEERLLPAQEVGARLAAAGAQLRTGVEGARRSVSALCCEDCREGVLTALEAAMRSTVEGVGKALAGE